MTVYETPVKGKISIIKHSDDGTTGIETPEVGAEFEVYLKSAGSYAEAKESERDYLVCDENGFAQTKMLPYGIYVVHQTVGWDNTEWVDDFEVNVCENEEDYFYIINDAVLTSYVKIVKKDAETGNIIPVAGIGFKVWNCDTESYVVQTVNYPTPTDINTFYTDETGTLMLPNELVYGNYELHEVQSANGYVLDSTPVPFTIDGTVDTVVKKLQNYVKYIATREGSVPVKENSGNEPATEKQCELIVSLLREFPDSTQTFAYEDYSKASTQKNASALISEIIENNVDRIGERENYIGYLANRPGAVKFDTHALFSQEDTPIDLNAVAKEIANHGGNVWTHVVALRRDNAQRMGYDNLTAWRELVKRQIPNIAKAQKIDMQNLRWYAAFHDKETNPHVHIVVYHACKLWMFLLELRIVRSHDVLRTYKVSVEYLCRDVIKAVFLDDLIDIFHLDFLKVVFHS